MILVDYPGHLVAFVLVLASGLLAFAAFRASQLDTRERARYRRPLMLLHYAAILMLLAILWDPSMSRSHETFGRNRVVTIFDTSESMSVADLGDQSRLDRALERFDACFRPGAEDGPDYRIYGFDEHAYHSGTIRRGGLRRWGARSDLHEVFAMLAAHDRTVTSPGGGGPLAGVVILTDGRVEDLDARQYPPLSRQDLPILLVGVGSRKPSRDLAVADMAAPAGASVDRPIAVKVTVTDMRTTDTPITVELLCDEMLVDSRRVTPKPRSGARSGSEARVECVVPPQPLGTHVLTARAGPAPSEINIANNRRSVCVEVMQERTLNVLLYTQWAGFDIGKIRQALAWDKRIDVDFGFDVIRDPARAARASQAVGYATLSDVNERFNEYDVIILGPCRVSTQRDNIYEFVAKRGGGLILLPGSTVEGLATAREGGLSTTLPVIFDTGSQVGFANSHGGSRNLSRFWPPERKAVGLTFEAEVKSVFDPNVFADPQWRVSPYYRIADLKPAATALVTSDDEPVVSVHRLGRGRVCLLNASKLFLLYREDREGGALRELMCRLVAHLGRTPSKGAGIELFAERTADDPARVAFHAQVMDESFEPLGGANVLLTVGDRVVVMEPTAQGSYRTVLDWGPAQSVVATAQAEIHGRFLGERTLATHLPPLHDEMSCVDLNEPFLRALVDRVGGRYVHIDELDADAGESFEAKRRIGTSESIRSVWPRWSVLTAICLLLSTGWFVRRAIGLV